MSEKIIIENFGGLKKVEFELRNINILIGPQASGKSVAVKLLYFFKNFTLEMRKSISNDDTKREFDKKQKEKFITYFPEDSWPVESFKIEYRTGEHWIVIHKQGSKSLSLTYSNEYKRIFDESRKKLKNRHKREEQNGKGLVTIFDEMSHFSTSVGSRISRTALFNQYFVPAGRSFFANFQSNIFSLLSENQSFDPFLIEFGAFYEKFKHPFFIKELEKKKNEFHVLMGEVISGKFKRESGKDYIIHNDNRKVNLLNTSSGQQEILPLVIVLNTLCNLKTLIGGNAVLYIEEPEAHLFPTAQKKIVQLLARTFNSDIRKFQIIITTHSPYILSAFNNLIEAGKIVDEDASKEKAVNKVIPKEEAIKPKDIIAYSLFNGKKKVLIDKTTKLIAQNELDAVSDELSVEFGKLLDIEF